MSDPIHQWPIAEQWAEPSGNSGELTDEQKRAQFEAWALSQALPINRTNGHYDWYDVRMRWEGWQACAAAGIPQQDTSKGASWAEN